MLFLDLALEMTGKGALEAGLSAVRSAAPSTLLGGLLALLQQPLASACMSALPGQGGSAVLASVTGQLQLLSQDCPGKPTCLATLGASGPLAESFLVGSLKRRLCILLAASSNHVHILSDREVPNALVLICCWLADDTNLAACSDCAC